MVKHNDDRGRTKASGALRANIKTYRVNKNKRGTKKRDLFLAGTGKKQIASSAGRISSGPRNRRKKKKKTADEHPLVKAFSDSLSQTTIHISTKLPQTLSDKLQIALSRITATTARSMTYLTAAAKIKGRLFTSSPLLSVKSRKEILQFQELIGEKRELLDELWVQWAECMGEIEKLGKMEGILEWKDTNNSFSTEDRHGVPDQAIDDEELDLLIKGVKAVGGIWSKKMDDSEKKTADEVLQQQQLAATVLL